MSTRHLATSLCWPAPLGLTELIVLAIGLRTGQLDQRLCSLMVVMAMVTTLTPVLLPIVVHPWWRASPSPHHY